MRPQCSLRRDPAAWLALALIAVAAGYTSWLLLGFGKLSPAASIGGVSTLGGALVAGTFAWQVHRGAVFHGLDRLMSWLVVVACGGYWFVAFASPTGGVAPSPGLGGALLFGLALGLIPLIVTGLLLLPLSKPGQQNVILFELDLVIVAWASAMILWHLVLYPIGRAAGADLASMILVAIRPSADLALIFFAIAVSRVPVPGIGLPVKRLLVTAFVFVFASNVMLAVHSLDPTVQNVPLADACRCWFWAALATIWLVLVRNPASVQVGPAGVLPSLTRLPYVAIAVAFLVPAAASWSDLAEMEQYVPAMGLLIVLVLARLALTARWNARLVESGAAHRLEARFRALVQNASDVVVLIDADSRIRDLTPSVVKLLGRQVGDLAGTRLSELVHGSDAGAAMAAVAQVAASPDARHQAEWRFRRADGSTCETEVLIANMLEVPEVAGIVLTIRDIGERKDLERALTFQALHDPLTGLANRALFGDRVEHAIEKLGRRPGKVAVLFLDLDDFKRVNDGHGHGAGDRLLTAAAARISGVLRDGDTAARFGGDEFAVLLEEIENLEGATRVADRLHEALARPLDVVGVDESVTASIGIALATDAGTDLEELLRNADVAMYVAKANGKRRTEVFDPDMQAQVRDRLVLDIDLRRALRRDEFEVYYQPVWATESRRMVGVEALVRWHHPRRGLLAPGSFIEEAEESGLIVEIGRFVLRAACRQVAAWDRAGGPIADLSVAVNLSPRQMREPDLLQTISDVVRESRLRPDRLNLEITEAVLVDDSPEMVQLLQRIKALGVRISIDDFGTGYSSLSYLRRLPVDTLKIAKPFVDVVTNGSKDEALAQAIVTLARSLELEVVAEGVEHESQLEILAAMGCELGQGYLVSPPVPGEDLPAVAATTWGQPGVRLTAFGWSITRKAGEPAYQFDWAAAGPDAAPTPLVRPGSAPLLLPDERSA
jgi:diguanylate cyclase (GGDEF)-like protein/PAS domain S-box-containing protein